VYLDEAYAATLAQLAAMLPTLSTHPNPQRWWASSAPLATSVPLWNLRKRALRSNGGEMVGSSPDRLAYVGHTAEVMSLTPEGKIKSTHPDPEDRATWAQANPALGYRIEESYLEGEYKTLGPALFMRERLGVGDPLVDDAEAAPAKIDPEHWKACHVSHHVDVERERCVFGVDATPGSGRVSVAVGAGTPSAPYVELAKHEIGSAWVPAYIVERVLKWNPLAIGIDAFGPAGGLVGPIRAALLEAGLNPDVLRVATTSEMKQWCEGFHVDVIEHRLQVPDQMAPLDLAAANAAERKVGDGWLWDRRDPSVPLSPLVAATIARGLAVELIPEPVSEFFVY